MINNTAAANTQNCYVDLRYPYSGQAIGIDPTPPTFAPFVFQLSEQDKEALCAMIREVVVDAIKEVLDARDEAKRRERFNDQW